MCVYVCLCFCVSAWVSINNVPYTRKRKGTFDVIRALASGRRAQIKWRGALGSFGTPI